MTIEFPFHHRLRVRWSEVDAQRVVFNGHYLNYLDTAISDYWRAVGLPYPEGLAHLKGDIFVRRNVLEYHAPARLDDWLDIGVRCERIGRSSITMVWSMQANGRLLVTGETVYVFTQLTTGRPEPVPAAVRLQLERQAQGAPVHSLHCGDWASLAPLARAVRTAVFIEEQAIPESEEWDEDDTQALHAVVANLAGLPLATGRLITSGLPQGEAKIGRMAVLRSSRGVGLGEQVLQALIGAAREQSVHTLSLHAQTSAQAFYQRAGFAPDGPVFDEVGIPHIVMTLRL
ncbi:MAG: YbgC/FadM family acyl-CoA thioesterase [Aquabacterium sp.]|uniref:YbgC/FadM family acyl-CoA thioesterase n=1 Tax=Aquabacterium sp. TaxID=1872578 RepID=UPI00271BEE55|nr:YbgC/FadM family acyl-CoA thioesterase [Aquabacterium sp.]MDO9003423.1 YbgC/FadM family acyl-CoA thioesterase [Aquabacterium sp.]